MSVPDSNYILTVNAGSSSVKLALFDAMRRRLSEARIEGIGLPAAHLITQGLEGIDGVTRSVDVPDYATALGILRDWLKGGMAATAIVAIGHRIVHGGPKYYLPTVITDEVIADLRTLTIFDSEHLPIEIEFIEAFGRMFPSATQVACFDTAFHHDLPDVAQRFPIPRRYGAQGVRRYGFHGLAYESVLQTVQQLDGVAVSGRLVIAHLGSGASLAAVHFGKSIDTTMGLTPASGVPMSTRSGDLDPGLIVYLVQHEHLDTQELSDIVNFKSGLLGISETTPDMKALLDHEADDQRAKEAVDLFCYQVRKNIGALAAAMGGIDMLVFSGGIGEQAPKIRARVCEELAFLGVELAEERNQTNDGRISTDASRVAVHVIHADEAAMIAGHVHITLMEGAK